jgi:secondary thiamine-phosphate synthase enzyme
MFSYTVKTNRRKEMIDVTGLVKKAVAEAGMESGVAVAFVPHTTAGVTINENADPDVQRDVLTHLEKLVPPDSNFRHSEGNADAHIQASLMGSSVTVIVEKGGLVLGTWQSVFFCEFDGPRSRKLMVQLLPERKGLRLKHEG